MGLLTRLHSRQSRIRGEEREVTGQIIEEMEQRGITWRLVEVPGGVGMKINIDDQADGRKGEQRK